MKRGKLARFTSRTGTAFAWAKQCFALTLMLVATLPAQAQASDQNLLRMAEILGAVHHLRDVCGANEGALWRNKMIDLLDVANVSEDERQELVTHFNSGFYGAERDYPVCTGKAARETNILLNEGHMLAAKLAADQSLFSAEPTVPDAAN